jgi:tRNA 2-selenouridine synthase
VDAFLSNTGRVVDVRSPQEFTQGHIPGAHNLPLFSDDERAQVGTCYKHQGRPAAIQLGLELVGPRLAALGQELRRLGQHNTPLRLHCWRGGMRSGSIAWLANTLEVPVQLLEGGYKAYRRWVLETFERPWPLLVLGGRTGTGKTDLLLALQRQGAAVVDLEGLAHHRGSSFGGLGLPAQPSSEHYENRLAASLQGHKGQGPIWIEAESAQVGRCRIPAGLWRQMGEAPAIEIQRPLTERVEQLVAVYGSHGQEALRQATERIARRLGPQRTTAALEAIDGCDWAGACLQMLEYYDRCYDHELSRRDTPVLASIDLVGITADAAAVQLLREAARRDLS